MYDITLIPGQDTTYSYGRDDYGEYGSALQAELELQVPEPLDFTPNGSLEQSEIIAAYTKNQAPSVTLASLSPSRLSICSVVQQDYLSRARLG